MKGSIKILFTYDDSPTDENSYEIFKKLIELIYNAQSVIRKE